MNCIIIFILPDVNMGLKVALTSLHLSPLRPSIWAFQIWSVYDVPLPKSKPPKVRLTKELKSLTATIFLC